MGEGYGSGFAYDVVAPAGFDCGLGRASEDPDEPGRGGWAADRRVGCFRDVEVCGQASGEGLRQDLGLEEFRGSVVAADQEVGGVRGDEDSRWA